MEYKDEITNIYNESESRKNRVCVYCGANEECREHAYPLTYFHVDRNTARTLYIASGWKTIPSCKCCNTLASTHYSKSFAHRKAIILRRFDRKYKNWIIAPEWTTDEIDDMEGLLKNYIEESLEKTRFLKMRRENLSIPIPIYAYE